MNLYKSIIFSLAIGISSLFCACEDENSSIGSIISGGEVEITVINDTVNLHGRALEIQNFDSKTGNLMLGKIQDKNYGNLDCSFVTRLMCATSLEVDDSLFFPQRVDSCKLIMGAKRTDIIGDSLAPQRLTVYKLTKQLPSDITNAFDPEGYYDPSQPFASKSYTLSEIANRDSVFYNNNYIDLSIDLGKEFGQEIFEKYKSEPEIFQWPVDMARNFLPGLYIKSTFGNGSVANITSFYIGVFYHSLEKGTTVVDGDTIPSINRMTHLTVPFTVSPEVLSSNNISYTPAENIVSSNNSEDGKVIVTTPGGYVATFDFPVEDLINKYNAGNIHLSTVNELTLYIPAEEYKTSSGIGVAQNLLMVKSSEYENFFKEGKIPDNLTSFTGVYDSLNKRYVFSSMRDYFINLLKQPEIKPQDCEFILVPVELTTETASSYYGDGASYITKCVPFTSKPTLTLLDTTQAIISFSFSTQMID